MTKPTIREKIVRILEQPFEADLTRKEGFTEARKNLAIKILALISEEMKKCLLTEEEIGNALQPVCDEEEKTYYCSDTTSISCINCDPVAQAQLNAILKVLE